MISGILHARETSVQLEEKSDLENKSHIRLLWELQ